MRPDGGKGRLAPGPEQQALGLRLAGAAGGRAIVARDGLDGGDQMIDFGLAAVELHDQQRFDIERIAGVDEILRRMDGEPVHHFHAAGNDAGGDDRGDAIGGALDRWESRSARRGRRAASAAAAPSLP